MARRVYASRRGWHRRCCSVTQLQHPRPIMRKVSILPAACSVLAIACASDSHAKQVDDARMAQIEEQSKAQADTAEKSAEAQTKQVQSAYEKHEEEANPSSAKQEMNELA